MNIALLWMGIPWSKHVESVAFSPTIICLRCVPTRPSWDHGWPQGGSDYLVRYQRAFNRGFVSRHADRFPRWNYGEKKLALNARLLSRMLTWQRICSKTPSTVPHRHLWQVHHGAIFTPESGSINILVYQCGLVAIIDCALHECKYLSKTKNDELENIWESEVGPMIVLRMKWIYISYIT